MSIYTVGEEGANLDVCVVILPGPTFADNVINLNAVIDVAATGVTATGKYKQQLSKMFLFLYVHTSEPS